MIFCFNLLNDNVYCLHLCLSVCEAGVIGKRIEGDSLPRHLLSCESSIFVKEKPDREKHKTKKSKLCSTTYKNRLSVYVDEERF